MAYSSVNPFNGKLLKIFDRLTEKQLEEKLAAADTCYKTWKHTSYAERAKIVANAARLLGERVDEFAHSIPIMEFPVYVNVTVLRENQPYERRVARAQSMDIDARCPS